MGAEATIFVDRQHYSDEDGEEGDSPGTASVQVAGGDGDLEGDGFDDDDMGIDNDVKSEELRKHEHEIREFDQVSCLLRSMLV